jgi:hypothetical protein
MLVFHFSYHQGSFLSLSFIWVSWEEVSDDFEQRMKALWKSLLFRVIAGQTKSNETCRECVCVHLAVLGTRCLEFILQSYCSSGASLTISTCVTPSYSIKVLNWSLTRVSLLSHCRFLTPSNNESDSHALIRTISKICPVSSFLEDTIMYQWITIIFLHLPCYLRVELSGHYIGNLSFRKFTAIWSIFIIKAW